jgi:hypothetical protein
VLSSADRTRICGPNWRSLIDRRCCSRRSAGRLSSGCARSTSVCGGRCSGHQGVCRRVRSIRLCRLRTTRRARFSGGRCARRVSLCCTATASSACPSCTRCCTCTATRCTAGNRPRPSPTPCGTRSSKGAPCGPSAAVRDTCAATAPAPRRTGAGAGRSVRAVGARPLVAVSSSQPGSRRRGRRGCLRSTRGRRRAGRDRDARRSRVARSR